jgi:two-component system LytT family response regulator
MAPAPRYLRHVLVHHGERAYLLPVDRIDRVQADRNYITLHASGNSFELRGTIGAFADRLDPAHFLRISRSDIVRLDAVREMQPWSHGDYRVVMRDGVTLTWSRRFRARTESQFH